MAQAAGVGTIILSQLHYPGHPYSTYSVSASHIRCTGG